MTRGGEDNTRQPLAHRKGWGRGSAQGRKRITQSAGSNHTGGLSGVISPLKRMKGNFHVQFGKGGVARRLKADEDYPTLLNTQ